MAPDSMSPDLCIMAKNSFDIIRSKELCCTIAGVLSVYDPRLGNKCNHLGDNMSVMFLTNIYPPHHPYSIITYNKIIVRSERCLDNVVEVNIMHLVPQGRSL